VNQMVQYFKKINYFYRTIAQNWNCYSNNLNWNKHQL
jgi:hypothetical protein